MAGPKTKFYCRECGQESARWLGRCPGCGEWNTLIEERVEKSKPTENRGIVQAIPLTEIQTMEGQRLDTGSQELNRVFGGGVVEGSFVLLSGEPGIGKSTLFLQMAEYLSRKENVLYVSGEESARQIKLRADRMELSSSRVHILADNSLEAVRSEVLNKGYKVIFIDSIQTMLLEDVQSAPGSVSQVREGASFLLKLAKENEITVFLAGHITKEGAIAGPRVLEHMVDTVLYFEGDQHHIFRLLRAVKNRFGPANEIGVFEMRGCGLADVTNPSMFFMGDHTQVSAGSGVAVVMEGTRPLLVEVQALVTSSIFTPPRRTVNGMDYHRLLMLLAVLDKRAGYAFGARDVFVNIAGGLDVDEPAADLAVIASVMSGIKDQPLGNMALIGELGLTGEIRGVSHIEQRIREAEKFGFRNCLVPEVNADSIGRTDCRIIPVKNIEEVLDFLF
ncbi:MAG: DNA repair protein RadA [Dehalobacter sp. 4CP]|uniref:DNA repair protein RadA n=1 Tax=Dehalobacter sp. CP TaxID=2594474 RepID=UPI0013CC08B7|nr:DNA repair protein RadA [Dehalobacter sp.]NBJ16950.1 DNA repair protein RadA [Dehalobacter sp. 4CP]